MTFIVLAFKVCLISDPSHCELRELTYSANDVTLMQCVTQGQSEIARWAQDNPRWRVSKHRCHTWNDQEQEA